MVSGHADRRRDDRLMADGWTAVGAVWDGKWMKSMLQDTLMGGKIDSCVLDNRWMDK